MKIYHWLLFGSLGSFVQDISAQDQPGKNIDSLISKMGEKIISDSLAPGLSIGVYNNGKTSFYNFGTTVKGENISPTKNTLYEIGSITKTFSSYLLAKAVLEKKINLSDDIRKYIDGDYPNLEFAGQPVRIVHLANMSAGIPESVPAEPPAVVKASVDSIAYIKAMIYAEYTRNNFFDGLHQVQLDTVPGFKRRHSNGGAQLLAYILENVYGKPFGELVQQYILRPSGMKNTHFLVPNHDLKLLANGYNEKMLLTPPFNVPYFMSIGGLKSSAADMIKYIEVQLNKMDKIAGFTQARTLNLDAQTGKAVNLLPGDKISSAIYSVGLNWFLYQYDNGHTQIWTDGSTSGFCSYIVFYPEINSGIILLANKTDEKIFRKLPGVAYDIFKALEAQKNYK